MAKITLKDLTINNMFSYGEDNTLDLNSFDITQLTASNGSGKSTIALIIQEILFGKNIKGIKKGDILNRYGNGKSWSGSLTFNVDEEPYAVSVSRNGNSGKVSFYNGTTDLTEHKVLDTYKKIAEILGMDFEIFSQLTYQSSTDLLDFIKATDTNRKKFLINLFGLEKYIAIGDTLKLKISEVEKDLNKLDGELNGINRFLAEANIGEKQELKEIPTINEAIREELGLIQAELKQYVSQCKRIDKNNLLLSDRDALKFDMSLKSPEVNPTLFEELETLQSDIAKTKNHMDNVNKQLKAIDTADSCYACGQSIDNSQAMQMKGNLEEDLFSSTKTINRLNDELKVLVEERNKFVEETDVFNNNQKSIEKFEQFSQLIDTSLPKDYPDYGKLERKEKSLKIQIRDQEEARQEIVEHNEQVKIHNTKVDTLTEQKAQFLNRQDVVNSDIINLKSKVQNLTILRKAFSTTGIVAFKLENLAKELEETINHYLSEFSDGQFQLIFRLTGEKLNIVIFNHGKETTIESVSGGEFSRIQTSILLSIRKLLSRLGGSHINLLFLDEVTGVLDESGKERLVEILQQENDLNVFLISHDFTHPLIEKVSITKQNNISKIEG
jgi:DNA repair exonuclease SbcCD ATPase subunit